MTDPDAVTALYWLALFCTFVTAFAWWCDRKTRKRPNRYRTDVLPSPDARCVVGNWRAGNEVDGANDNHWLETHT